MVRACFKEGRVDVVRLVKEIYTVGMRGKGKLKNNWLGVIVSDMKKTGVSEKN